MNFASLAINKNVFMLSKCIICVGNISARPLTILAKYCQKSALNTSSDIPTSSEQNYLKETDAPNTEIDLSKPMFPEVIQKQDDQVGFWETERGLYVKDTALTATGRLLRMFVSIERYDNWWENIVDHQDKYFDRKNEVNPYYFGRFGGEWTLCLKVIQLKGAFKLVTDDRWIEDARHLRTPEKKDCTVEGVDLRNSVINAQGMGCFDHVGYVKYLNLSDSKLFDNRCMSKLHSISHSLEYLDISGTAVTPGGFGYLRLFTKLRWLNVSRLKNKQLVESLLPFLREIVPHDCVVISNDETPPLLYGTEIPYRSPTNPEKDVLLAEDSGIGDIELFNARHNCTSLQLHDPTAVHSLWKTPLVGSERKFYLKADEPRSKSMLKTLVEYIHKAEQYKPLL